MYSATELLRTSFIKGIAKTTASVTVLGVVSFFYYLYNNVNNVKQDTSEKPKINIKNIYSIDFAKVFNNNKKENLEIVKKDESKESEESTIETCDAADVDNTVDNTVDTEVNYIHDLDIFEKNVYKDNNFKKLFDKL